jgi:hypothetical protein
MAGSLSGVGKIHPYTETTSLSFRPKKVSGLRVKGKKVVAEVVSTVMRTGAGTGGVVLVTAVGGTK